MTDLTHKSLCALAVDWLKRPGSRNGPGCQVAISETQNHVSKEIPDAIGWRAMAHSGPGSTIVEVKISRADFLADRNKPHRFNPEIGMGAYRYYMAPEGMIAQDELPDRWGLIEVNQRSHVKVRCGHVLQHYRDPDVWRHEQYNVQAEVSMLVLALARVGDPQLVQDRLRESGNKLARMVRANEELTTKNRQLVAEVCRLKSGDEPFKAASQRVRADLQAFQSPNKD